MCKHRRTKWRRNSRAEMCTVISLLSSTQLPRLIRRPVEVDAETGHVLHATLPLQQMGCTHLRWCRSHLCSYTGYQMQSSFSAFTGSLLVEAVSCNHDLYRTGLTDCCCCHAAAERDFVDLGRTLLDSKAHPDTAWHHMESEHAQGSGVHRWRVLLSLVPSSPDMPPCPWPGTHLRSITEGAWRGPLGS
jgi:hypothetical protein